jgi:inosine-uridine nucleoside N-ribohydrolase
VKLSGQNGVVQKLLIDADPGLCDALAVLAAMVDPALDVLAITATSGTVSGQQATRNIHYLIELADPVRHPRIGQSDGSLVPAESAPAGMPAQALLNGRFGLGDTQPQVPDLHNRRESAKLLVDTVREFPGEVRLLTLGPLTNVAMAFELDPELPMLINGLVILGGSFHSGGDVTAAAEFNIWADPLAARTVLQSHAGKTLVPLDVSYQPVLTFENVERLTGLIPSTPIGELVASGMQYLMRATRQHLPFEGVALPSMAALAVAARAEKFSVAPYSVDVETSGEIATGLTVCDQRPVKARQRNCDVVTMIDAPAIIDYFCRNIRRVSG